MINEDLLSPKDVEINRLKIVIEKFKKYDEERKKYYRNAMRELGELKSYVLELEETSKDLSKNKLIKKIAQYKDLYNHQILINNTLRNKEVLAPELIQLSFYKDNYLKLKELSEKLQEKLIEAEKKIKKLNKTISLLIYERESLKKESSENVI